MQIQATTMDFKSHRMNVRNSYCFKLLLISVAAIHLGLIHALTDTTDLNTGNLDQMQNYSAQEGNFGFDANIEPFDTPDDVTHSNISLRSNLDSHSELKSSRKSLEDCRAKVLEILQRHHNSHKQAPKAPDGNSVSSSSQNPSPRHEILPGTSTEQLENLTSLDNEHIPQCSTTGRYLPVQCHKIGYCWCVNKYGQAIKNTAFDANTEPNCDPTLYESEDIDSLIVTGISAHRLRNFLRGSSSANSHANTARVFTNSSDEPGSSSYPISDGDDFNKRVQASQEPSLALAPNECTLSRDNARNRASRHDDKDGIWIPECDSDNPKLYAQKQCHKSKVCWCVDQITGLPLRTNEQLAVRSNLNCTEIRSRSGEDSFASKQNRQKLTTSFYYQGFSDSCDAYQRAEFMRDIVNQFRLQIAEHIRLNPSSSPPDGMPGSNPYGLSDVNISTWKFHLLDSDHNNTLNDREWSRFRNNFKLIDRLEEFQRHGPGTRIPPLKILRHQRRCWRAFLNFCSGSDILINSISLKDWLNCTELPSKNLRTFNYDRALLNAFAHTKEAAITRSKSRNPFSSLLKPD